MGWAIFHRNALMFYLFTKVVVAVVVVGGGVGGAGGDGVH